MTKPEGGQDNNTAPKLTRCAIYARYSSDMQRESSIEDQIRKCREYAAKQGWVVVEEYVLYDQAISGAVFDERGSLQSLLVKAEQRPRPFEILLIDDTSRLARYLEDALYSVKIFDFNGIDIVSVSQGLHSSNQSGRELFTIFGMMDERFLRDLASKVLRGQEGCVHSGYIAGGRCYGYKNVPIEDTTRRGDYGRAFVIGVIREIVPEEAAIVRRIFEMYASGISMDGIARILRAERVPAPRPPRKNSIRAWSGDGIGETLRNPIYVGKYIFGRTKTVRDPKTRKMVARSVPEKDWIRSDRPKWRIVSDELWNKVQAQRKMRSQLGGCKLGGLERTKRCEAYLFSGRLFCGAALPDASDKICARPMTIVNNDNDDMGRYGCGAHRYKGACTNGFTIRRDTLEKQLLSWLTRELPEGNQLQPISDSFYAKAKKRLVEHEAEACRNAINVPELHRELAERRLEAVNMTDFIVASGRQSWPTVQARLAAAEARIMEIDKALARAKEPAPMIAFTTDEIKEHLRGQLRDLQSVMTSAPLAGKQIIRKHFRKITLTPGDVAGEPVFHVAVEFELGGGDSGVVLNGSVDASMRQYGFSTITVNGLTLDTSRVRRKPEAPKQEAENGGGSTPILLTPDAEANDPSQGSGSGRKEIHA
jgi:site-specific DNA recombinase